VIQWIARTRKAFKKFFHDELWLSKELSTINACKIEHLIDLQITEKLEEKLK
jgi:Mn-dependent DtxR family transcriptional regulator